VKDKLSTKDGLPYDCPDIDLIELPRLKLSLTARKDHEGVLRLYSIDHVDLFIANESSHDSMTIKLLQGNQLFMSRFYLHE
jgi:hypothetical protein